MLFYHPIFRNTTVQFVALFMVVAIAVHTITTSYVTPEKASNILNIYLDRIRYGRPLPFPPLPPPDDDEYLAICMLVRNQGKDLPEVLTHHYYHMGIRRFYILDDGSEPPLSSTPDYGIPSSAITFHVLPQEGKKVRGRQLGIYDDCSNRWGSKHTWMGFFDTDEFLEVTDPSPYNTLKTILTTFAQNDTIGALAVQWLVHTSAGHKERQESNRASFDVCLADGHVFHTDQYKSFVRTALYERALTPHSFLTKNGTITIGENGDLVDPVYSMRRPSTRNMLALHHYAIKSKEEFAEKMLRKGANGITRGWSYWNQMERKPHVPCTSLTTYTP
jgi:Glycosyltransferase family 92